MSESRTPSSDVSLDQSESDLNSNDIPSNMKSISTNLFYSQEIQTSETPFRERHLPSKERKFNHSGNKQNAANFNKGVHHKIKHMPAQLKNHPIDVDKILKSIQNEKLADLIIRSRQKKEQVEKVHKIFRDSANPIAMAKPFSFLYNADQTNLKESKNSYRDFSDIECDIETGTIDLIHSRQLEESDIGNEEEPANKSSSTRKFFKSGSNSRNEFKITNKIKGTINNGKISLLQRKSLLAWKNHPKSNLETFSSEQTLVDDILKTLDETTKDDEISNNNNGICSEKENCLCIAQNKSPDAPQPCHNGLKDIPQNQKLCPLAIRKSVEKMDSLPIYSWMNSSKRVKYFDSVNKKHDLTQYQIDAGQKEFGMIQCKGCGLAYTAHEAEEEKFHKSFHSYIFVFRYKHYPDENIVSHHKEWSNDGRIICITESAHWQRLNRVRNILQLVDYELGISTPSLPRTFMIYLAVANSQVRGLCLVHPLKEAHKYHCIDGLDFCSEETFSAKLGVSRIWVSPLDRRKQIGLKLINAVQTHTIPGIKIPFSEIAFSAPTTYGKRFARKITNREDFLVYY